MNTVADSAAERVAVRVAALESTSLAASLDAHGFATTGPLLDADDCAALAGAYGDDSRFRSRVVMARHGFGRGEYRYFAYPLPPIVQALRESMYPLLAPIARAWHTRMGLDAAVPLTLDAQLARCHSAGQSRPTPLLLRYDDGDHNCLHQDVYGEQVFPLQATVLLSKPGLEFDGGEFVLVEQRPRMQSRVHVVPLRQGEAVLFGVRHRPVRGSRGDYRVAMRHGVSTVRQGRRHTLGVIFHDAA